LLTNVLIAQNVVTLCKDPIVSCTGLKGAIALAIRAQLLTAMLAMLKNMYTHTGTQASIQTGIQTDTKRRSDAELMAVFSCC
jgi:hypothetical protein